MLDLNLTKELEAEGLARDLIRAIQQARKDLGFDISDHIKLAIEIAEEHIEMLQLFIPLINSQTLADAKFIKINQNEFEHMVKKEMEGIEVSLGISKV